MAPGRQRKLHAPSLPSAAHGLLVTINNRIHSKRQELFKKFIIVNIIAVIPWLQPLIFTFFTQAALFLELGCF